MRKITCGFCGFFFFFYNQFYLKILWLKGIIIIKCSTMMEIYSNMGILFTLKGLSSEDSTPLMQENILHVVTHAVSDEESAEVNANDQLEASKLVLQSLFSLIRGEVEQLDSRALPLCLHQVSC